MTENTLHISLNFSEPLHVSRGELPDKLFMNFTKSILKLKSGRSMNPCENGLSSEVPV